MGAAPTLELLLLGRTVYGVGIGFVMHAAPAYIAEAAPARVRGLLIRHALPPALHYPVLHYSCTAPLTCTAFFPLVAEHIATWWPALHHSPALHFSRLLLSILPLGGRHCDLARAVLRVLICVARSLKEVFIVGGILLGYLTSYLFVDDVGGWRLMYGLAAGPAVILLAGMVGTPVPQPLHRSQVPKDEGLQAHALASMHAQT